MNLKSHTLQVNPFIYCSVCFLMVNSSFFSVIFCHGCPAWSVVHVVRTGNPTAVLCLPRVKIEYKSRDVSLPTNGGERTQCMYSVWVVYVANEPEPHAYIYCIWRYIRIYMLQKAVQHRSANLTMYTASISQSQVFVLKLRAVPSGICRTLSYVCKHWSGRPIGISYKIALKNFFLEKSTRNR